MEPDNRHFEIDHTRFKQRQRQRNKTIVDPGWDLDCQGASCTRSISCIFTDFMNETFPNVQFYFPSRVQDSAE